MPESSRRLSSRSVCLYRRIYNAHSMMQYNVGSLPSISSGFFANICQSAAKREMFPPVALVRILEDDDDDRQQSAMRSWTESVVPSYFPEGERINKLLHANLDVFMCRKLQVNICCLLIFFFPAEWLTLAFSHTLLPFSIVSVGTYSPRLDRFGSPEV